MAELRQAARGSGRNDAGLSFLVRLLIDTMYIMLIVRFEDLKGWPGRDRDIDAAEVWGCPREHIVDCCAVGGVTLQREAFGTSVRVDLDAHSKSVATFASTSSIPAAWWPR